MQIQLTFDTLYGTFSRTLSILGKRSVDEEGNRHFSDITLSTLERPLADDYFDQAIIDLVTESDAMVTASTDESITLDFPANHNAALEPAVKKACQAYCVSYALYSWLTLVAPKLAPKYLTDCQRQSGAVIRLIHQKNPPTAGAANPLDVTSTVTSTT